MTIIVGIALILSILSHAFTVLLLTRLHQNEKKELHDRIMSRDYPEYMQGKDYELELQRKKQEIEKEKKPIKEKGLTEAQIEDRKAAKEF